jgi:hypothetical protein
MNEKVYHWADLDKTAWGAGPWVDEPDKMQWTDDATGLPCLVRRNARGGNLCGYVGVAPGHPWHGKGYGESLTGDEHRLDTLTEVHGGLTYSDECMTGEDEATGICHVPEPGQPEHVWWFGFDCAHCFDLRPGDARYGFRPIDGEAYRTFEYVRAECASLAKQLAEVSA